MTASLSPVPADDWRRSAECLDADPELFFPIGDTHPDDRARTRHALDMCRRCDVRAECLAFALEHGEAGIWGATTEAERKAYKRRQQRPTRGDSRAPYMWDELHDLMRQGIPAGQWPAKLGTTRNALVKRLDRHGRRDLARIVERETRRVGVR